ncbi:MAG TPA: aminotransferase class III-fold pyridoxal phosphate-dependent enzyme [Planctomycetaceae bacterium]|nr:aminotransferase class III-fold pyridoxal phosphate-dependent enzyme [Planctomycetaceae bacterium]
MSTLMQFTDQNRLFSLWGRDPLAVSTLLHKQYRLHQASGDNERTSEVRVIDEITNFVSTSGAMTEGRLYEVPMLPQEILDQPDRALDYMLQAVHQAVDWGASLVGLGSMTGIVGGRGQYLADRCSASVTTGNSLTTYAALQTLYQACEEVELDLKSETVAIVGVPGSIATAAARLLSAQCGKILLVGRQASSPAMKLSRELQAELVLDIDEALKRSRIIVCATSSGDCIHQSALRPGSIVVDIGVPSDVRGSSPLRGDVLILNGGLIGVPESVPLDSKMLWFQHGMIPACLGETIVLALEDRPESLSLGRELDLDSIQQIGAIAASHGFDFSRLLSFGRELEPERLLKFQKQLTGRRRTANAPESIQNLSARAENWFARHINPVLQAMSHRTGFVKTFVRGEGAYLYDSKGRRYLDFVAGFGSLNLGHNSPSITSAIQQALQEQAPGFAQSAINPYAATLAHRLAQLAPGDLEMTFFANSGSEAVEAGLKLARRVTRRKAFLSCNGGYHGKTMGALSVTGNETYREPFSPLLDSCKRIAYCDYDSLERELSTGQYAAFVVEPIQAEGGMNVPQRGFLREAQALCRATGTLLIVDEVQTGMGRTGTLFALEQERVSPDILLLAKSLGGGLMPIGAMLTTRELWMKAYGNVQSFALHTSTFGGGSLACAAGLAALNQLSSPEILGNTVRRGEQLRTALEEMCERFQCLKEVRGRGLLLGLEFQPLSETILHHWKNVDRGGITEFLVPGYEDSLSSFSALRAMLVLLEGYSIYTQTARSNPYVLRIQPPLTIDEEQVDSFLDALRATCEEIDATDRMFGAIVSKNSVAEFERNAAPVLPETPDNTPSSK